MDGEIAYLHGLYTHMQAQVSSILFVPTDFVAVCSALALHHTHSHTHQTQAVTAPPRTPTLQ